MGNLLAYKNHWHFKATTKEKKDKMRFLAIIQVSEGLNYDPILTSEENGHFQVNDWIINANLDPNSAALISIENKEGSVRFHSQMPSRAGAAVLIEKIDGSEIVKTAKDEYPKSIISASKRQ